MTRQLAVAFEAASNLSLPEQDELAARILDELAWERGGTSGLRDAKLKRLVNEAREDIRAGRVRELRLEDI